MQNREMLEQGKFSANSAHRDPEMAADLSQRLANPKILCNSCRGGVWNESLEEA
jgi:hypothetical protein